MATDSRDRQDDSEERDGPVQEPEVLEAEIIIEGWCINCICVGRHHLGDGNGVCLHCNCSEFVADPDGDIMDRLKGMLVKAVEDIEQPVDIPIFEEIIVTTPKPIRMKTETVTTIIVFLGKISRACNRCGMVKLYKEFDDPRDPDSLCTSCGELDMLDSMADYQRDEIAELEDEIAENEYAYDEAQERQEIIDNVLRGLDE